MNERQRELYAIIQLDLARFENALGWVIMKPDVRVLPEIRRAQADALQQALEERRDRLVDLMRADP